MSTFVKSLVTLTFLACVSCGGSSGGGSNAGSSSDGEVNAGSEQTTDPVIPNNANDSVSPIVGITQCAQVIDAVFIENFEAEILENIGTGCDYFVPASVEMEDLSSIAAGVTIVLGESVELSLSSATLSIEGTADQPIVFQAQDADTPWGFVSIDAKSISVLNAVFSGGGGVPATVDYSAESYEKAAVLIGYTGVASAVAKVVNSTFADSRSAGLLLGGRLTVEEFSGNHFDNNASYSIALGSVGAEDLISSLHTNRFTGNSIQPVLIDFENYRGLSTLSFESIIFADLGVPYMFANLLPDLSMTSSKLLFREGVEIWFTPESSLSRNTLHVMGAFDNPVVFKGIPGNTNNWGGISIGSDSVMRHFTLIGGGLGEATDGASLYLGGAGFNSARQSDNYMIEFGSIENSQGVGIRCNSNGNTDTANLRAISISGSAFGDIDAGCAIVADDLVASPEELLAEQQEYDTYTVHADNCRNILFKERIDTPIVLENTAQDCDYLVVGSNELRSNVTIESGATLIFSRGAALEVDVLRAIGTEEEPVSLRGNSAMAGYWKGLLVTGNGTAIENASIVDAGGIQGSYSVVGGAEIEFELSDATSIKAYALGLLGLNNALSSVTIDRSSHVGLYTGPDASFFSLSNNTISNVGTFSSYLNPQSVAAFSQGVMVDADNPSIFGNGVYLSNRGLSSQYRTIRTNSSNLSSKVPVGESMALTNIGVPWLSTTLTVDDSSLSIAAGTELRLVHGLIVSGENSSLTIAGLDDNPVVLRGLKDDPSDLAWEGLDLMPRANSAYTIDRAEIKGADIGVYVRRGATGSISISNTSVSEGDAGIVCASPMTAQLLLENVMFEGLSGEQIDNVCGL